MSADNHPHELSSLGVHLQENFLDSLGITKYRLAKDIEVPLGQIEQIISGKCAINADIDHRLCKYFGLEEGYWLAMQNASNLEVKEACIPPEFSRNVTWGAKQPSGPVPDFVINKNYRIEEVRNETAITCPNGDILVLNNTAQIILRLLCDDLSFEQVVYRTSNFFDISMQHAYIDVSEFLDQLDSAGVVEMTDNIRLSLENFDKRENSHQDKVSAYFSRRHFVAGAVTLGASLLTSTSALGAETRVTNKNRSNDLLGQWVEKSSTRRVWRDSLGNEVELPTHITHVAPFGPFAQAVLESICIGDLIVLTSRGLHASAEREYFENTVYDKAIFDTDEENADAEIVDLIVDIGSSSERLTPSIEAPISETEVPIIHMIATIEDLPQAYRTLGEMLENTKAFELADYVAQILAIFAQGREQLQHSERKHVYYAQGEMGLSTRNADTLIDDIIQLIGADNVAHDLDTAKCGDVEVSQVKAWKPDIVIVAAEESDSKDDDETICLTRSVWQTICQNEKCDIEFVPREPFLWIDRSPLTMQTLGALWLANKVYPDIYTYDMLEEFRKYADLFFETAYTKDEARKILGCDTD